MSAVQIRFVAGTHGLIVRVIEYTLDDPNRPGHGQLPPWDNRINPRVVKKKMSKFAKKRAEHYNLPQPKRPFEQSVVILK